jgi:hypothetical protein
MARERGSEGRVGTVLAALEAERDRWAVMLDRLPEWARTAPRSASGWTIHDFVAHLYAWQQVSNARLEAALRGGDPRMPEWLQGADPESDEDVQRFNDRIHAQHRDRVWHEVVAMWRDGFDRLIERARVLPAEVLLEPDRFGWLKGAPLVAVLEGSLEHHREHWDRHTPMADADRR